MTTSVPPVNLNKLGPSTQSAIRTLLNEFYYRGWKDRSGAAISIVRGLESAGGILSAKQAARLVPADFLVQNDLDRDKVEDLLLTLAKRQS